MTNNLKTFAFVGAISAFTTAATFSILNNYNKKVIFSEANPTNVKFASNISGEPTSIATDFSFAAEKTVHSVVHITSKMTPKAVSQQQQQMPKDLSDLFGDNFGGFKQPSNQTMVASGSGVIISADGYIVTNNHVVADSDELEVVLDDKRSYKAKVVATDPNTDIAVIKIKAENLPFIKFGNSDDLKVGQWVLAVGNPFNLESTVTAGIISAKGRAIGILNKSENGNKNANPLESFIQTDAAVNPGNSGGALVNLSGELIGINTAIATETGSFTGYSFAVPTSIVKKVTDDLLKYGNVQRGFLGIAIEEIDGKKAEQYDLKTSQGIYIRSFTDNKSAAKTDGLKVGDVITKIDGSNITTAAQLQELVARHHPGETVQVTVMDTNGTIKTYPVILKNQLGTNVIVKDTENSQIKLEDLGVKIGDVPAVEKSKLNINGGVKILGLDENSLLAQNGMEQGFVITKIDGGTVENAKDFADKMDGRKGKIKIEGTDPQEPGSKYYFQLNSKWF